jgi:hypothetical protein
MTLRGLLTASVLCLPASFAPPCLAADENSAAAYIEQLYAQRVPGQDAAYSPRLEKRWHACLERADGEADMCPGFNMFVMAPKAPLTNLKIEPVSDDGKTATVKASFNNGDRDVEVLIRLIYDPEEAWLIEEMTSECVTLTDALNWTPKC